LSGASGFIGKHLSNELLSRGILLEILPHSELLSMDSDLNLRRKWERIGKTQGFDSFFHLAWNVNSISWRETPSQKKLIKNTEIFLQIVKGFEYILSTGSCQEYLPKPSKLKEDSELAFDCNYVIDKHAMHNSLKEYSNSTGAGFSWVRLFNIFGKGDHPNRIVSLLLNAAKTGLEFQLTKPDHALDLLHVEDAVNGLLKIGMERSSGTYNLGSGIPVKPSSIRHFINLTKEANFDISTSNSLEDSFNLAHIADISNLLSLGWKPQHSLAQDLLFMLRDSDVRVD
jgi:dTDP-6-deoxy-L-talose 4-dehydrogenase (NAD+)